jgi:hypothetical protein
MIKQTSRIFLPAVLAAVVAIGASAETRTVDVDAFSRIDAANGVAVEVSFGGAPAVTIDGRSERIARIEVDVRGETLEIRPQRSGFFRSNNLNGVVVRVTAERLTGVEVANGAHAVVRDAPADATLRLTASNGGVIEIDGACDALDADASRGAVIDASDLDCRVAVAEASMGGAVDVRARESVDVSASMGGHVEFGGEAEIVRSSASMGGMIGRSVND